MFILKYESNQPVVRMSQWLRIFKKRRTLSSEFFTCNKFDTTRKKITPPTTKKNFCLKRSIITDIRISSPADFLLIPFWFYLLMITKSKVKHGSLRNKQSMRGRSFDWHLIFNLKINYTHQIPRPMLLLRSSFDIHCINILKKFWLDRNFMKYQMNLPSCKLFIWCPL